MVNNSYGTVKQLPIPALDALRGLACLLVIFCHAGYVQFVPLVVGIGSLGVMLFYTLSGFLMAYHYFPKGFSARYWTAFLIRRFVRVYPAFLIATFGYLMLQHYLPRGFPLTDGKGGITGLIPSWLLCESRGVFWTIPLEIKFYLLYPLIAYAFFLLSTRTLFLAMLVFWAGLFFVNIDKGYLMTNGGLSYFISGVFSGIILKRCNLDKIRPVFWELIVLACPFAFYFCFKLLDRSNIWAYGWLFAPSMALIILSLAKSRGICQQLFENPVSRFIGHISYSLYLVHWFIINAAKIIFPKISFFVFVLVFITAWFYYLLIESPFSRMARNMSTAFLNRYRSRLLSRIFCFPAGNL